MRRTIVVVDDFYADPDAVRSAALRMEFSSAGRYNYPGWQSAKAFSTDAIRERFQSLTGERVTVDPDRFTWGGFRLITAETGDFTKVHSDTAVDWAAMVYLTPDCDASAGTGFFQHRETGFEGPPSDEQARKLGYADANAFEEKVARRDMADLDAWRVVSSVSPRYNRLVLFRGCELYHAPLKGQGSTPQSARLTHNFFFNTKPLDPGAAS
ncbi:DUF6445 family protein [Streptomyces chattanoogensis]